MPISVTNTSGEVASPSALIGDYETLHVKIDASALTDDEIDSNGHLKPNVPLSLDGLLLADPAGVGNEAQVPCVTVEATKIAAGNAAADIAAGTDAFVACAVNGTLNRDVMEDVLGRALSANEIAALNGPNSKLVLSLT